MSHSLLKMFTKPHTSHVSGRSDKRHFRHFAFKHQPTQRDNSLQTGSTDDNSHLKGMNKDPRARAGVTRPSATAYRPDTSCARDLRVPKAANETQPLLLGQMQQGFTIQPRGFVYQTSCVNQTSATARRIVRSKSALHRFTKRLNATSRCAYHLAGV